MAIPIILGGIALATAGYGAKKGLDAKEDFNTAKRLNRRAERIFDESSNELESSKEKTNSNLEELGKLKVSIYQNSLTDFIKILSQIKNIDFKNNLDLGITLPNNHQEMLEMEESVFKINEIIGGGLAAAGGGALAGFGALGGVGMLASASTGTAIASLSGVAATNATLAWLGGGSLAVGGGGMALGTMVLGGIVAGPVLAIGGMMMASKAEEAKYNARSNKNKAEVAAEQMNIAKVVLDEISLRVEEFDSVLIPLNKIFEEYIDKIETIVDKSNDYSKYSENDKKIVMVTASIAQTIKNVCDAPIIDEEGTVTRKSKRVMKKAKIFISKLEEV